jgi:hypothetical protein
MLNMGPRGVVYRKWSLLELTLCPVGANPNALAGVVRRGFCKEVLDDNKDLFGDDWGDIMKMIVDVALDQESGVEDPVVGDIIGDPVTIELDSLPNIDPVLDGVEELEKKISDINVVLKELTSAIDVLLSQAKCATETMQRALTEMDAHALSVGAAHSCEDLYGDLFDEIKSFREELEEY